MDKIIYLFIPLISVSGVAYFFPVGQESGQNLWFRPPAYIFAIVWPILLSLIGYSWYLRPNLYLYYAFLTFLLSTWSILWKYSKLYSFINIIITLFFNIYLTFINYPKTVDIYLIPLSLWLTFASFLNFYSI
jgi:tryptophan-rich sensory protein